VRIALITLLIVVTGGIGGCEPDYSGTAFRCDTDRGGSRGCPDDESCISGRCRRGGVTAQVACGAGVICSVEQQCCYDFENGARCVPAGDLCPGRGALCDSKNDCANGDGCCSDETTACGESCNKHACAVDADCPSEEPNCCHQFLSTPWGECSLYDC
jgi:hypothetical protein